MGHNGHVTSETKSKPVRVLWLIKGLGPGGAEGLLVTFARVADLEGLRIDVAYVRPDKTQLVPDLASLGVSAHCLGAEGGSWPLSLRRLLLKGGFDVVHAHSPLMAGVARLVAQTLPRNRRPAVASTEHNEWGSYGLRTRLLNAVTAPLDDHRWAVSRRVRASMWPWVGKGSEVLVQGIEFDRFLPGPEARARVRRDLGIPDDAVIAVTVANLRRPKDYPNLLRASRAAIDEVPNLFVLALGQGPLKDEIERLHQEMHLGNRVQFLGFRTDVADVLAASDMFVIASAHEGGPLSLIEAMRVGLPAVATDVGFVSDAIQDGVHGLIVPTGDSASLARALVSLAREPERRRRLGEAARAASDQFDVRRAVGRQVAIYRDLATRNTAGVV